MIAHRSKPFQLSYHLLVFFFFYVDSFLTLQPNEVQKIYKTGSFRVQDTVGKFIFDVLFYVVFFL